MIELIDNSKLKLIQNPEKEEILEKVAAEIIRRLGETAPNSQEAANEAPAEELPERTPE